MFKVTKRKNNIYVHEKIQYPPKVLEQNENNFLVSKIVLILKKHFKQNGSRYGPTKRGA